MIVKEESPFYLLVGLGNPGSAYEYTRHNIGFHILEAMAKECGWAFKTVSRLQARLAFGVWEGKKILLLLPQTYMNSSGESVRLCVDYYKVQLQHIMVVADDIAIPYQSLRIKPSGSSGGHNGLKSIEAHLSTQIYPRMKVGVGDRLHGSLSDHVLSRFSEKEMEKMPQIVERALRSIQVWLNQGIVMAMQYANSHREEIKPEQKVGE